MTYLELAGGLVLLVIGGDFLVRGAVGVARHFGLSPLLIGITLVGFGTSTPELVTSVQAALIGSPGIAVGNVVGSNIANSLLIVGACALIYPMVVSRGAMARDGTVMIAVTFALLGIVFLGDVGRPLGAALVVALVAYIVFTYLRERNSADESAMLHIAEGAQIEAAPTRIGVAALLTVGGLVLTIVGARLLVAGAVGLAAAAGISETVVGLTIVAVGTSLPELVTSVVAALRKQADVAFGNVVGSNIYNILGILGITALVQPIPIPPEIAVFDIWVLLAATFGLVVFGLTGLRINRWEAVALLAAYVGYVSYLVIATL
jgi:cation:H+ antiporter